MPYRKGSKWFNNNDEEIRNPRAYFNSCGKGEEYEAAMERQIGDAEEDALSIIVGKEERRSELEDAGYSNEQDYADDYYAGENSDLGEPPDMSGYDESEDNDYDGGNDYDDEI